MMETTDLLKKVRKIEIKSKGLSNQIFSGEYHSAFKGRGMAFSEVREYYPGDDIRSIDWNVTARFNHPYIKVFQEERELTVMLIVDISRSGDFGTQGQFKKDLITELCAVLAFSAIQNNDKIGAILFSDRIEKFIPPKKGKTHILRIIRELLETKPGGNGTRIGLSLRYFTNMIKKRCIAFLITDFLDTDYVDDLKIASRKHDLVALRIRDIRESELPAAGMISMADAETGRQVVVDTSNSRIRDNYHKKWLKRQKELDDLLVRSGVDSAVIETGKSYIQPLLNLFKRREKRQ